MFVGAACGAAHIILWTYGPPAPRTHLPAGVRLVALQVGVSDQLMFLGMLDVATSLDARKWKVNTSSQAVRSRRLVVSHCRATFVSGMTW
jgi:hypothetical protein